MSLNILLTSILNRLKSVNIEVTSTSTSKLVSIPDSIVELPTFSVGYQDNFSTDDWSSTPFSVTVNKGEGVYTVTISLTQSLTSSDYLTIWFNQPPPTEVTSYTVTRVFGFLNLDAHVAQGGWVKVGTEFINYDTPISQPLISSAFFGCSGNFMYNNTNYVARNGCSRWYLIPLTERLTVEFGGGSGSTLVVMLKPIYYDTHEITFSSDTTVPEPPVWELPL